MVDFDRINRKNRQVFMVLDYETYSEVPLVTKGNKKGVGAYEYSVHPSTEILCVAWAIGTKSDFKNALSFGSPVPGVKSYIPSVRKPQPDFKEFCDALLNPDIILVAHNAFFEQVITKNVFAKKFMHARREIEAIPVSRWRCTAAMAASLSLPRGLEDAGAALGLSHQKDKEGSRLVNKLCKPRKPSKKDPSTRNMDPDDIERLTLYCRRDIEAELSLFVTIPELTDSEQELWEMDQEMNWRGVRIDRELVHCVQRLIDEEKVNLSHETAELSGYQIESTRQTAAVQDWIAENGMFLPNMRRKTLEDAVKLDDLDPDIRRMVELRLAESKSSLAKFLALELRSRFDGRIRDYTKFYGASTGRWAATGAQLQNLPRPTITAEEIQYLINLILREAA